MHQIIKREQVSVMAQSTQCGNFRYFLSPFYLKNYVKSTYFHRLHCNLFSRNIFQVRVNFPFFHTVVLQKYFFYVTDVTVTASRGHAEDTAVKSTKSMSASQDMTLEVKEKRSVEFIYLKNTVPQN